MNPKVKSGPQLEQFLFSEFYPNNATEINYPSMAESSSSSSSSNSATKSPIMEIAQDHLLSILLLLPVDSIISFTMTCTRFRPLACSETLWESVCRRFWGDASVDALKSHHHHHQLLLPWMKLYQQVSQLDTVFCHRLPDPDGEMLVPRPRASHSLNFVSDCLVLFGGGCEGGRHLDDTWVAYIGNDFQRTLMWQRISSGIPNGRFGHTSVVINGSLILFGGINDQGVRQNDTWVGQLASHETLGFTFSWRLLDVGDVAPPPRGAHGGCCIENWKKMVIHGGIGLHGLRLSDTWVLEISENLHFGNWREIHSHPSPPARSGHTMACIGVTQTVMFGGRGVGYEVLNDIWVLDIFEGSLKWVQILYDLQNIPGGLDLARVGHSATPIIGGQLLIHGGEDWNRHRKDDFWLLDVGAIWPARTQRKHKKGCPRKMWKRVKSKGFRPGCRSFHRACVDPSGCYVYVFGGMVDGLLQPEDPSSLRFDGDLFLVEPMLQL